MTTNRRTVHLLALLPLLAFASASRAENDHLPDYAAPAAAAPTRTSAAGVDSTRFAIKVARQNLVGVTVSNYGFIGNNFISRANGDVSLEYPLGSGLEHMVRGGIWIGAKAIDEIGLFTGVVTGAVDGAQGNATQGATEFSPAGLDIVSRSNLPTSVFYNPQAQSELDLTATFSDRPAKSSEGNSEQHRPMGLLVRQTNYMWSFSDFAHFVIFSYTIKNLGAPIQDLWFGMYSEMASGDKNAYAFWPPSSAGSSLGSWFNKKQIVYEDSLRLFREHYCASLPIPGGCRYEIAPAWMGYRLLGVRPGNVADPNDKKITFAAWNWSPGSVARDEDGEKYNVMSSGLITPIVGDSLLPQSGDPIELLAVGPFRQIDPGDSVTVDFAYVGGTTEEDIRAHSRVAQRAYDRNYIVPIPPPSPRLKVVAHESALELYWDNSPESATDVTSPDPHDWEGYRVYVGEKPLELHLVAQGDQVDTTSYNTGLDAFRLTTPIVIDGVTYHYRYTVRNLRNGFKYYVAVTAFDQGNPEIESLESGFTQNRTLAIPAPGPGEKAGREPSVFPNPYRVEARWDAGSSSRNHYLWFVNLPQRCTLRIFTLAGDEVFSTEFNGATYHGDNARGVRDTPPATLSGTTFAWDLITTNGQAAATGLYLFSVEDHAGGKRTVGKFLIVKSDREGL